MRTVQCINEFNKEKLNKPANSDQVYYSELNDWFTTNAFRSFGIKYVLQGSIYYKVNKKEYKVTKDNFLIATKQPHVTACFTSKDIVKSMCIDICEETIEDALTTLANEQKGEITDYDSGYLQHPNFSETIYSLKENPFGGQLTKLAALLNHSGEPVNIERDWFLEMVESIVTAEVKSQKFLENLHALKTSTKKEILKRIFAGRDFMDLLYLQNPDVKSVARKSNMSEFHFYRCFKQVFRVSPYQYMLSKRLEHAKQLLNDKELLVTEIASICKFRDVFTFSKAFKKKYGLSPSKCIRINDNATH